RLAHEVFGGPGAARRLGTRFAQPEGIGRRRPPRCALRRAGTWWRRQGMIFLGRTQTMAAQATDTLNSLLRGGLAAHESYQQALTKVGSDAGAEDLRRIHVEHREAANTWRQHVHKVGGKPDQDSGAWGTFAKAVEGVAKLFGNTAALKALKEGEDRGARDYESALQDTHVPAECKDLIRSKFLPQTRNHIATLDRLMQAK